MRALVIAAVRRIELAAAEARHRLEVCQPAPVACAQTVPDYLQARLARDDARREDVGRRVAELRALIAAQVADRIAREATHEHWLAMASAALVLNQFAEVGAAQARWQAGWNERRTIGFPLH